MAHHQAAMAQHAANVAAAHAQGQPMPGGPGPQWGVDPYFVGEEPQPLPPPHYHPPFFNPFFILQEQPDGNLAPPEAGQFHGPVFEHFLSQHQPIFEQAQDGEQPPPPMCLSVPQTSESSSPTHNYVKTFQFRRDSSRKSSFSEKNNNQAFTPKSPNKFHRNYKYSYGDSPDHKVGDDVGKRKFNRH